MMGRKASLFPKQYSRIQRFIVEDVCGSGAQGILLKCTDSRTNQIIAVKRYFPDNLTPLLKKRIKSEPNLPISSDYVVKAQEVFESSGYLHSVMNFVEVCNSYGSRGVSEDDHWNFHSESQSLQHVHCV